MSVRETTPAKWLRETIVMVDVAETPALAAAGEDAVIVKSWNWKKAVAVRTSGVLVAVIVRV